jgi:phasin family protein
MSKTATPNANSGATPKSPEIVEKALKANQTAAEKAVRAGKETAEKAFKAGSDATTRAYDQACSAAREHVQRSFPQAAGQFEEMATFQRANLEALFAAGATAMKGVETLSEEMLALGRKAMDDGMANSKKLLDCKTMQDVLALQTGLACTQMEELIARGGRFTDIAMQVAGEMIEPIQQCFGQAAEKAGKPTIG